MTKLKKNTMRKVVIFALSFLVLLTACEDKAPMEQNLYPETVYLVGSKSLIIDRDLALGYVQDTVYASVAISGSLPTPYDVSVVIEEYPQAIDDYNTRELGTNDVLYRNLDTSIYNFPNDETVVKKGEVYGTYPIYVRPETLHVDSLYMIALRLKSTTAFELAEQDTVVLMRFNRKNEYSGLYYMDGVIKNATNPNDSVIYKMPRNLQAVDDGNTVRIYHQKNEYTKGSTDYRPGYCFKISVNEDNSLSMQTWENFEITEGGGTYYPDMEVYKLWYNFTDDGTDYIVKGFLYLERKNDEEQRLINDWMEEHR